MTVAKPARVATLAVWRDDHLLMGLRRDSLLWTTPGGHLQETESPIAGALRELKEETGIDATPEQLQYLGAVHVPGRTGRPVELHMFQTDVGAREKLSIRNDPDHEVHGWSWVSASNGLPAGLKSSLHTPKNHLLRTLGLMQFDDTAKLSAPVALREGEHLPPAEARRMAGLGLEMTMAMGRKLPQAVLARARALVEGRGMSAKDIKDTASYFRLYGNCLGETDAQGNPSDRHLECMLWGGPSAAKWTTALAATLGSHRLSASRLANWIEPHTEERTDRYEGYRIDTAKDAAGKWSWTVYEGNTPAEDGRGFPSRAAAMEAARDMVRAFIRGQSQRRFAADQNEDTSGTEKGPTREVVSRPMHEVSADIKKAGIDDNDQDPEADKEIPGGPRRYTDAEMKEDPHEDLAE